MTNPIQRMFEDKHHTILRSQHTYDYPIFRVTLTLAQATTIVMQHGSHADLQAYVSRETEEPRKVELVMACLASGQGQPLFLTLPALLTTLPATRSAVLLALDNRTNDPRLLALCDVISTPSRQGGDFVLRHACMSGPDYDTVMQVSVRLLLPRAVTQAESVRTETQLDECYGLSADTRAALADSIPCLSDWYYKGAELKDHHVRLHTTRTTYAGYVARTLLGRSLVPCFLAALLTPDIPAELRVSQLSWLVEPVRATLLARLFADASMATPSAFYLFCAIERGSWVDAAGEAVQRLTSYPDFCAAMRAREHVGAP